MDSNENNFNENDLVQDPVVPDIDNLENTNEIKLDTKESTEIDYTKIQDIEFGSKVLLFFEYFTYLKEYFDISTIEYFDRCFAALYPYFCITVSFPVLFKNLKSFFLTRRFGFNEPLTSFGEDPNVERSGSNDNIPTNLETSNNKDSMKLNFNTENELVLNGSGYSNYVNGIQLRQQSKWYRTLCSMTQSPDLYGPIWINITASCSLFFSSCISHKIHDFNSVLPLSFFYELVFLTLSCSFLMAICIFTCNYYFTRDLTLNTFVSFLCVCGYTQIPLAILCKICIFLSLLKFFHPLQYILFVLKLFSYFYLFVSTSCSLSIALIPLDNRKNNFIYKLLAILSCYLTQSLFLTLIQKYIH